MPFTRIRCCRFSASRTFMAQPIRESAMRISVAQSAWQWTAVAAIGMVPLMCRAESCDPWKPLRSDNAGLWAAQADAECCRDLDRRLAEICRRLGQDAGAATVGQARPPAGSISNVTPSAAPTAQPARGSYRTPSGKTCYFGPRGGTYTITSSGRRTAAGADSRHQCAASDR